MLTFVRLCEQEDNSWSLSTTSHRLSAGSTERSCHIHYPRSTKWFLTKPVEESNIKYTSFVTPSGQYEFLRTPFRLYISPPVFQWFINFAFRDFIKRGFVLVYVDDIIVLASDLNEGSTRLNDVMQTAVENGLERKWSKCQFLQHFIEYLGYRIYHIRISPSEGKFMAVKWFLLPKTV